MRLAWIQLFFSVIAAELVAPKIEDLKNAPLVTFAHDFPKHSGKHFAVDRPQMVRINMTNSSPLTKTVYGITGFFTEPDDASKIVEELKTERVQIIVKPGKRSYLKYRFTPIMEPREVGLLIVIDYYDSDEPQYKSIGALDKIDLVYGDSPISIYILLIAIVGGTVYSFLGQSTDSKTKKAKKQKSAPVAKSEPKELAPGEPDMSWIPDHVLKAEAESPKSPRRSKRKAK